MKTQIHKEKVRNLTFFKHRRITTVLAWFLSVAILNMSVSCSYYNVKNVPTTQENISSTIKGFNNTEKYVIIHSNNMLWHLSDMIINEDTQTMSGTINPVNVMHNYSEPRENKRVHKYNKSKSSPLNEVHFYLKTSNVFQTNVAVNIPLSDINYISVNDKNTGRAVASVLLGTVGTLFVALLIVAATKSSCPFVYVKNGTNFDFVGELYPGTITPNMQNDDFLPLNNFNSENGEYTLKISNQLKEIQYTDFVQLVLFNHEKNIEVLIDSEGQFQTFQKINSPINVIQDNQLKNITSALHKDNDFYAFDTPLKTTNSTRNVIFEFENPDQNKEAKLYLTAKNSVWLDYIFGKFNEQFGVYYKTFQKNQQHVEFDTINKWKAEQHIPLSVYIKVNDKWKLIESVNTVGPMAMRNIVVPINLEGISGDNVQIKLETGFMFWEVDYVGLDFSENIDLKPEYISPSKALDQKGYDVTDLLSQVDSNYFTQPNIGDEVVISFPATNPNEGQTQTVFLKNRGYYNYIRDYKGIPDFETLKTFKEKNTFTKYSEKAYFDFVNYQPNQLAYHE